MAYIKLHMDVNNVTCPKCKADVSPLYKINNYTRKNLLAMDQTVRKPLCIRLTWFCPKCGGRNVRSIYGTHSMPETQVVMVRTEDLKLEV